MADPEQPQPQPEEDEDDVPQKTEEEILAEKRAKRAAIKAKYEASLLLKEGSGGASATSQSAVTAPTLPTLQALVKEGSLCASASPPLLATPSGVVGEAFAKVSLGGGGIGTPDASSAYHFSVIIIAPFLVIVPRSVSLFSAVPFFVYLNWS
jgi:serine/threonine-protein kinase PRP4